MSDKIMEAMRLEQEAKRLRLEALRETQQHERDTKARWDAEVGIDCYTSDDYCGLKVDGYRFYYGYEETVPEDVEDDWDESVEWAFVAWVEGVEVLRLATSQLHYQTDEEPLFYLVAGIGHFLRYARTEEDEG